MRDWSTWTNKKMISKIISRAACLAELTSNPKSFFNCPDLHGGSGFVRRWRWERGAGSLELGGRSWEQPRYNGASETKDYLANRRTLKEMGRQIKTLWTEIPRSRS